MSYPSEHSDLEYAQLQLQLEEALGIIDDLAKLHDSYIGYLVVHNNYNATGAQVIRERIERLKLKQ